MKYAVSEAGVSALRTMASAITESISTIKTLTSNVRSAAEGNSNTLGPHYTSLENALTEIEQSISAATDPAMSVSESLGSVADSYEEIIGNDPFGSASGN